MNNNLEYSIIIENVQQCLNKLDLDKADNLLQEGILKYPNKSELYDLYSEVLISLNKINDAKKAIEKSISLEPNINPEKYMSLGQLIDKPKIKLKHYSTAVIMLRDKLNNLQNCTNNSTAQATNYIKELKDTKYIITSALSSIAELYMTTNLCDEFNAENECEMCLKEAYTIDSNNIDVLLQYSNLRILRAKDKEAREYMEKAINIIYNIKSEEDLPESETIFNLAKNFSELEDYYNSIKLIDIAIQLDDQNLEYWYHAAYNHYKLKNYFNSYNCIERFRETQSKLNELDEELFIAVDELETELKKISNNNNNELTNNPLSNTDNNENEDEEECRNNNPMNIDD